MNTTTTNTNPNMQTFKQRYNKNVISYFDFGESQIEVNMSSSPKIVRIYINDKLVSKKWAFRKSSRHDFEINDKHAEVIVDIVNSKSGPVFVTFNVDGQNIDIDRWVKAPKTEKGLFDYLLIFFAFVMGSMAYQYVDGFIQGFFGL